MTALLLKPKYRVELSVEKKKHFYNVYDDENRLLAHLPGVTGFLDVINRPGLAIWGRNQALDSVQLALERHLAGEDEAEILMDRVWIDDVIKTARKKPDKIRDDAADLGTRAHLFIDSIIHGKEPELVPPDIAAPIQAFKQWWRNSGIELVLGDTKVASLIHGYGGSLDALGRRQGKFIILDWKTGNGIWKEHALQVAAYGQGFFESYGLYCQEGIIVRFGKKAPVDFETREIADLESSFMAFQHAKALKESLDLEHFLEVL